MDKVLPESWVNLPFTSVFDINGGTQPPKSEFIDEPKDGYVRLLQIRDFGLKPVPTYIPDKPNLRKCRKDDILIARYGASIGRIVTDQEGAYNVALAKVKIPYPIDKTYVRRILESHIFQDPILAIQRTAQNGFNKKDLNSINIPLLPLPEQKRIVAKLDKLFEQLEIIKASLEKIPVLLKNFRQQVLTQAVTGKLTEEWRKGKELHAPVLLNDGNEVEFEIVKYFNLHPSWIKSALGNCAQISRGKFTARPRNDPRYFSGKYPFMQIGDLPREGGIANSFSKTLNEEGKKISKSFPKDTVVIAIVGATIGITGILSKKMFFPDSLIGINSSSTLTNRYIEFHLRICKYGLREISYAGGGQPNIKIPTIKNLEIALPSFEEQMEIVNRVENLFVKSDAIEDLYKSLKAKIDKLPQSILHKAFKGELVPQLESDGDARDLLEEIRKLKTKIN